MKNKIKIVLIDDEKTIAGMYGEKLKMDGFRVFIARSGKKGIELILRHNPDLVILDIVMPDGDGFYVIEKTKNNEKTKNTPFIIFTNLDNSDDKKEFLKMGAKDYMVKAKYTPAQLSQKVSKALKKAVNRKKVVHKV